MAAQAADAALSFSRRTPIAVPGFGSPAPPSASQAAADEYFDRLDAAVATLQQPAVPAADSGAAPAVPSDDGFADVTAGEAPELATGQEPPEAAREAVAQAAVAAPIAAPAPGAPAQAPGIAQAFSVLFAAERGETAVEIPAYIGQLVQVPRRRRRVLLRRFDLGPCGDLAFGRAALPFLGRWPDAGRDDPRLGCGGRHWTQPVSANAVRTIGSPAGKVHLAEHHLRRRNCRRVRSTPWLDFDYSVENTKSRADSPHRGSAGQ